MKKQVVCIRTSAAVLRWPALVLLSILAFSAHAGKWQYSGVNRVVAVSDIHGDFGAMVATFQKAEIIGADLKWTGGDTHLVITGDLLDRGPDSRQVMDLIMRLEDEADSAGGRVHQLVGNHEVMNLAGDLRYVAVREYAAFAEDETEEEREQWFLLFKSRQAPEADELTVRESFDNLAPPGFFGHRRAFRADGYYGKWLLQKPLMIVIDGTAFVHGGVSPYVADYGLEGVNDTLGLDMTRYVAALDDLQDQRVLSPLDSLYDHADILNAAIEAQALDVSAQESAATVIALNDSPIHGPDSPLWYRGTVGCNELIEGDLLQSAFSRIGASRVVIGHTPTATRQILQRMNGRVIEIDTGMNHAAYKGSGNALEINDGVLTVINQSGETNSPPIEHPRRVGYRSADISADDLLALLASGEITRTRVDDYGRTLVEVTGTDQSVYAVFNEQTRKKGFQPDLAAYRLDLMLGLDMVPVTIRREVDGKSGTLQFLSAATKTETERAAAQSGSSAWCPLGRQWNTMYIFDALIFNAGRTPDFMFYSKDNWQLVLMQHNMAFKTSKGVPPYLRNIELQLTSSWTSALNKLTDEELKKELGDVLGKRELSALGKRRDQLVKEAAR